MSYNLRRVSDAKGDVGSCSQAMSWNEDGTLDKVVSNRPTIGCSMLVGSVTARSYSAKDYWLTTDVTEILEELKTNKTNYVRFKTGNSIYEWWSGQYPKTEDDRIEYLKSS